MSVAVIGVDEVGLGCLAGPVVAAAVVLEGTIDGLADSKKLSHNKRVVLAAQIRKEALYWAIAQSSAKFINKTNIARCHKDCIRAAVRIVRCYYPDEELILDGDVFVKGIGDHKPIVKADGKIPSVSAASIIAKVHRDTLMVEMAANYPRYGWERNKGYGSKEHLDALEEYGVTDQHRKAYAPVRRALVRRQQ